MVISPLLLQAPSSSEQGAVDSQEYGAVNSFSKEMFVQQTVSCSGPFLSLSSQGLPGCWRHLLAAEFSHGEFPFYLLYLAPVWPAQSWGNYLE